MSPLVGAGPTLLVAKRTGSPAMVRIPRVSISMRELDRLKCIQGLIDRQLKQKAVAERALGHPIDGQPPLSRVSKPSAPMMRWQAWSVRVGLHDRQRINDREVARCLLCHPHRIEHSRSSTGLRQDNRCFSQHASMYVFDGRSGT